MPAWGIVPVYILAFMSEENVYEEVVEDVEEVTTAETDATEGEVTESDEGINWEERARKAEALIVKHKKEPKQKVTQSGDTARLDRIELRQEGYPPEVVDSIMELGGVDALKNPIIKKSVEDMVTQYKAEQATRIQSGSGSPSVNKYSKQDLENMSVAELEKVLPHAQ